ncbi:MAG: formyltransferase family protein [Porticoccaceae bacterium]
MITYDYTHLKTEQLVFRYIKNEKVKEINLYALPFKPRKERAILIAHRPDMNRSVPTESLAELSKVNFQKWDGEEDISLKNDIFVIGGAGILDVSFANKKPIVNAHPGIIPVTRGLDSFKWAIYNNDPVGNTLHLIDNEVDKGEILQIMNTPVLTSDNLMTLARRHYENEIDMLANVLDVIESRVIPTGMEKPATMRMSAEVEAKMVRKFDDWKLKMTGLQKN